MKPFAFLILLLISLFSHAQGYQLVLPEGHDHSITDFAFFDSGKKGISLAIGGKALAWDIERGQLLAKLVDSNALGPIVFSPDSQYFFMGKQVAYDTTSLLIFSRKELELSAQVSLPKCSGNIFNNLQYRFSDGNKILTLKHPRNDRFFSVDVERGSLLQYSFQYDFDDEINWQYNIRDTFYYLFPGSERFAFEKGDSIGVHVKNRTVYLARHLEAPVTNLFSENDDRIYYVYDDFIDMLDMSRGEYTASLLTGMKGIRNAAISPDEKLMGVLTSDRQVHLWDLSVKKKLFQVPAPDHITAMHFDRTGTMLFLVSQQYQYSPDPEVNTSLSYVDIQEKKWVEVRKIGSDAPFYLPEAMLVMTGDDGSDLHYDVQISRFHDVVKDSTLGTFYNLIPVNDSLIVQASFNISLDGRTAFIESSNSIASTSNDEQQKFISLLRGLFGTQLAFIKNRTAIYKINGYTDISDYFEAERVSNRSRFLLNKDRLFNLSTRKEIISVYQVSGSGTIIKTPDNYYMSSGLPRWMNFRKGDKLISFEQLDVRFNRPDKVLEALGNPDTALIRSYRKAWEKRIKKLGIDTLAFKDGSSVPECDIMNRDNIEFEQEDIFLPLHIRARDSLYFLDRFNIWVNESPVFGQRGIRIKKRETKDFDTTVLIRLSRGENRIEASVFNSNGIESFRTPLLVNHSPAGQETDSLHFIGIGMDRFVDADHNLRYSVKDIRDLAGRLRAKYGNSIIIDTIFNEQVSVSSVQALKKRLYNRSVNDKVILAYSGHGLLSRDFDYYLSTHAVNFDKPEENGLPYDELENLLDSIPARKKLLLIDACHSGEVDKQELVRIDKAVDSLGLKKGIKPLALKSEAGHLGLKNSFELMQALFSNMSKSTGATIISAAAGTQFALERSDLQNGVFTFAILEAMNKNPHLKITELKRVVGERVEQLTNGLQKPTSRRETLGVDWEL